MSRWARAPARSRKRAHRVQIMAGHARRTLMGKASRICCASLGLLLLLSACGEGPRGVRERRGPPDTGAYLSELASLKTFSEAG